MERRLDYQNKITKVRRLSKRTIEELKYSKKISRNGKKSHEETIW